MLAIDDLLACPDCGGDVSLDDDEVHCPRCGTVGHRRLGHLDFTRGHRLTLAAHGTFDLDEDEALARSVIGEGGTTYDDGLRFVLPRKAWTAGDDCCERRAVARAAKRYDRVEREAGDRHGDAILDKVGAVLEARGRAFTDGVALEAGGGTGKYLLGFHRRFRGVVFVDCSLTNIVLAERLAREQGLDQVAFVRADVERLPFRSRAFALVHQNGVIEHVAEPEAMVKESMRVTAPDGCYVCLSPNRYPITKEPHFEVRLFGVFPPPLRRRIIRRTRGVHTEAGTDLRSLGQLKAVFRRAGVPHPRPFFIPPRLPSIARSTALRRIVKSLLDSAIGGRVVRAVLNGPFLPIAPYHLVVNVADDVTDAGRATT